MVDPPVVVRGGVKQTSCFFTITYFQEEKKNWRSKKCGGKAPHFLSLNQDIVASPQEEKCGLKHVIHILRRPVGLHVITLTLSNGNMQVLIAYLKL